MTCCLNSACHNPPNPDGTMFCSNCGTGLVVLRNHYRPIKSLGGGGFGKTYLAEDIDKLNEHCVIKQFAPQVQGTASLNKATELFEQEAKRLQQLGEHSQIPTLLAYFEEDTRLYLVQQFINGQNLLDELKKQGLFNEQKTRELLLDLLYILKTVHQHKVIHRDIKPENIIRRSDGKLVLIDFGASKQLTMTVMPRPGTKIASFGYAPLEQMQDGEAYPASDLYSVGATCFHLLSGIHPYPLFLQQGYTWVANWRQHLPQPVSQELGEMLDKLLQKEYQQRYQSTEEVLQDLNPPPPSIPPTQSGIPAQALPPVIVPSQPPIPTPVAPTKLPVKLTLKLKARQQRLLAGVAITLGGLVLTQFVGYVRYGLFPTNPVSLIANKDSDVFLKRTLTGHSYWVGSVAISPNGKTLVSGSGDGTIKLWNLATGEQIRTLIRHSSPVKTFTISPDGKTLASNGVIDILGKRDNDKTIKLWNLETGKQIRTFIGHSDSVNSVTFSPDGKTLASGSGSFSFTLNNANNSNDKTIKLWNLETGKQIRTFIGHSSWINSVAISPDGKTLVSGSSDETIKLWNLETGEQIRTFTGHSESVNSVAISPDGKTLVSGSSDETIKLWNLETGEQIRTFTGHSESVNSVAISPDSKTLVSGSSDETIKLWNLETGEQIRTFTGHSDPVNSVAISPDGKTLVSGSSDETIKIWRLE
ncbi:protein kinase domain-containing protein [Halotia branconii]|uniref:Serine/threonine-protein kinase n=1 Tax=Halotia branconii CENA392 TaxID=1539056 RepID=A0AAJ6PAH0_9CYAN|nr:serine/threonine-protein kinase [Halotia branconii]WGV26771.1 serine/threonine-protein kinase [Halotia branconii CENA392]